MMAATINANHTLRKRKSLHLWHIHTAISIMCGCFDYKFNIKKGVIFSSQTGKRKSYWTDVQRTSWSDLSKIFFRNRSAILIVVSHMAEKCSFTFTHRMAILKREKIFYHRSGIGQSNDKNRSYYIFTSILMVHSIRSSSSHIITIQWHSWAEHTILKEILFPKFYCPFAANTPSNTSNKYHNKYSYSTFQANDENLHIWNNQTIRATTKVEQFFQTKSNSIWNQPQQYTAISVCRTKCEYESEYLQ